MDNHHGEKWENTQIKQVGKLVGCISRALSISVTRILDFNKPVAKNKRKTRDRHVTKVFRYLTTGGPWQEGSWLLAPGMEWWCSTGRT